MTAVNIILAMVGTLIVSVSGVLQWCKTDQGTTGPNDHKTRRGPGDRNILRIHGSLDFSPSLLLMGFLMLVKFFLDAHLFLIPLPFVRLDISNIHHDITRCCKILKYMLCKGPN